MSTDRAVRIATWNVNGRRTPELVRALEDRAWDIACLQEVTAGMLVGLKAHDAWDVVCGLDLDAEGARGWKSPHAAAIVTRNGFRVWDASIPPGHRIPMRNVSADVRGPVSLQVASWHSLHSGDGREREPRAAAKMETYRGLAAWISTTKGALVVGADTNHWSAATDTLDYPQPPAADDRYFDENLFFSRERRHRLHDSLRTYLRSHPEVATSLPTDDPTKPLIATYSLRHRDERMDYLLHSPDLRVTKHVCEFDKTLSDHAYVMATFRPSADGGSTA